MTLSSLLRDRRGASAAEFALVLPLFLLFLLGIIDAGRLLFELNEVRKAAQVGTRMAVVTAPIAGGLSSASYVGIDPGTGTALTQGDIIPASALGRITCTDNGCTCVTGPCPALGTYNSATFNGIVARMHAHFDPITASNVTVSYYGSGLGFAGDPNGPDISPTVEVVVNGAQIPDVNRIKFTPVTSLLFATFNLPSVRTSMTGEDQNGTASY